MKEALGARITVVEQVYHQELHEEPIQAVTRYSRNLKSTEQVYIRKLSITEEWSDVDVGWVKECSCFFLKNLAGTVPSINPTTEEKELLDSQIIEVSFSLVEPYWPFLIYPYGDSFRGCPKDLTNIKVRCQKGEAKAMLHILPN